ncbi:MAG: HEAT repeat domain-containing protein, partial [Acidobacteriota bacterium]
QAGQRPTAAVLTAAIDQLGSFDFGVRTNAARTVRRATAVDAAPLLVRAARSHRDEYVRFRALVILSGLGDASAAAVMSDLIRDRDDRIRTVVYQWFEHHPDPATLPALLAALPDERSEFVRPALTRAIAAHEKDPRAMAALKPLVMRGEDLFRGAVIDALGDYKGNYALADIVEVAKLDGPLQDDAITAIGRLGDSSTKAVLAALQTSVPDERRPSVAAALCLIGVDCAAEEEFLVKTLRFAAATDDAQPLLRGAVHGLGVLALRGREGALTSLIDAGIPAKASARAPIALGVGLVALRNPPLVLRVLEGRSDVADVANLLRDAFDMLSEDFDEERFFAAARQAYWDAAVGSSRRRLAEVLIDELEF